MLAHCYTPHCTPGPSPYAYKMKVQGSLTRRLAARRGRDGACRPLAPSHVDACNPLLQANPTWAQDKHEGREFPLYARLLVSPLRAPSRADPSGLGHAATIYSSVQGPPGVETPTELEWPVSRHDVLMWMMNTNLLPCLTCATNPVFLK
jgi:hypothetical protein